jgi:ESCRT-II complex subunit VPS22
MAQQKADEMKAISFQSALDTIEKLEVKLTEFAKKHQDEIQNDPVFRQRFLEMCAPIGVDPLVASKKSFWGQMMGGMGDFYHELAVKVAEVCLASRSRNGGIMSLTEVALILECRKTRLGMANANQSSVSTADITIAIQKLSKLGGGFRIVTVGASTMVISVPTELDNDHMQVMEVATVNGYGKGITLDQVQQATGWTSDRATRALELLLQEGMAWLDTHQGETNYWFPSVWQENRAATGISI